MKTRIMKADYQMLRLKAIMKAVQGCIVLFAYKTTAKLEPEGLSTIIQPRLLKAINNLKK